ncbi:conserved membrane hypothetical protein [Candidatus Sulfopaludibacter sp. SbA4]|nr:conserved membrane hypothetical protein [Candidatus Sulfopaludibacter sp. SbA4]
MSSPASPRTGTGTLDLLEDAVHLLRQAPLSTTVLHSIGSVPFALAALRYWNDITNPRTSDFTCALEAFAMAVLLIWMNCWRAVFAGRLRRQLAGSPDTPWTLRRLWRLVAGQAFLGATKLVMMPLAMLVMFPLAPTVAFYRNTAVLADRDDLDLSQVMARSRRLAGLEARQSWALLLILTFLWLIVAVNLAIALGILPQLVRMLTGYESAFSRSGAFFVENPLFVMLVFAVSWIAFDPFVQAVYCVRCFHGESMETGEDLRAGLRALRAAVPAAALALLLLTAAMPARATVSPAELEKSVHQTMQAHEYDWRIPPTPPAATRTPWLVRMADHMIAGLKAVTHAAANALGRLLRWLFGDRFPQPQPGAPPSSGLHGSVYLLLAAVILMAAWIAWRRRRSRRVKPAIAAASLEPVRLDAEDLTPDRLPEESWLDLAERCLREENLLLALRALYLANLAWLGRREFITIHPGKTNREYELELRRKARAFTQAGTDARTLFAGNVTAFERAWYGLHEVAPDDIAAFRQRVDQMKRAAA